MEECQTYSMLCDPSGAHCFSSTKTHSANHSTDRSGICQPFSLCTYSLICAERQNICIRLYAGNKYYGFLPNLTPMGIFRRLPYYYIGYVMGQKQLFKSIRPQRDLLCCIGFFAASILLFEWHLHEKNFLLHIALFYPFNICFLFGMLYGCKMLDNWRLSLITNLSIGTLVIIGLHIVPITIVNFGLEHLLHINGGICYHWYEALPVALLITITLYPIILFGKHHVPILLGRKSA